MSSPMMSAYMVEIMTSQVTYVPVVCVLYNTLLKNSKFPVWNDFQFYLTDRQVDKIKKLSHSSLRNRDKFRAKVLLHYRFVFQFMFLFVFKISHSIEIKLFLDHKLMFVNRQIDRQTERQTEVNQLLNPTFCFVYAE